MMFGGCCERGQSTHMTSIVKCRLSDAFNVMRHGKRNYVLGSEVEIALRLYASANLQDLGLDGPEHCAEWARDNFNDMFLRPD